MSLENLTKEEISAKLKALCQYASANKYGLMLFTSRDYGIRIDVYKRDCQGFNSDVIASSYFLSEIIGYLDIDETEMRIKADALGIEIKPMMKLHGDDWKRMNFVYPITEQDREFWKEAFAKEASFEDVVDKIYDRQ